ncbi:hypothetical protein ACWC6I_25690 [Streptomyces sp. NPDC001414]
MHPYRPREAGSPASGALRGLRAGLLAVLCVLLPLAGHALARCHAPRLIIVAAMAAVAVPGAVVLTRRRLTDAQLLAVLAIAQLACHAAYAMPGAGAGASGAGTGGSAASLSSLVEHDAAAGRPAGVLVAGHLVTLLLTARLLGLSERLLWQSTALVTVVRRLLLFLWPRLAAGRGTGPRVALPESAAPGWSALPVRLHEGRAPPRDGRSSLALLRPSPIGGPCLP